MRELTAHGYTIDTQVTKTTPALAELITAGFSPPFREKSSAWLTVLDCRGDALYKARHPRRGFGSFSAIPPLITNTLLYIENRRLLEAHPQSNPAIEWPRLASAVFDKRCS